MLGQDNKYPYEPPYEDQVVFYQGTTVRKNPQGANRKAKICPICNYPSHIRMLSKPCMHLFCYECYQKNTFSCGVCGSLNSQIVRIGDKQIIHSCDAYCQKAFDSAELLNEHIRKHELLLGQHQ